MIAALAFWLLAQSDEIGLTEGVAIQGVARRAFETHSDPVLLEMLRNDWRAPKVGDAVVLASGEKKSWQSIKADATGSFPQSLFSNGWAYFEVERNEPEIMLFEASGTWDVYAVGEHRGADIFGYGWLRLPVKLKAGKNAFMFAPGRAPLKVRLLPPPSEQFLNMDDATLPDIVEGESGETWAGVIVVNATENWVRDLTVDATVADTQIETRLPSIPPLTYRKVAIRLQIPRGLAPGETPLNLSLRRGSKEIERRATALRVRTPLQTRKVTFISDIDGSVQYYAVHPAQTPGDAKALVLALHGARTEALEMADDYKGKDWCHIVCPTNRRPFGFDWEDIGRLDAIEVLEHAQHSLATDPLRVTLTGHSMGGHGAWSVGMHFPDKWAAVAPCAAWISVFGYGNSTRTDPQTAAEHAMYNAANASDTLALIHNALSYPIYMHHGDADEDVPFSESETMKAELEKIGHMDVTLNVVKGGGHWFGTESIDWPGLFEFLKDMRLNPGRNNVDFTTVNLAASSRAWWVQVLQQERWMAPSRVRFTRGAKLVGKTDNVAALHLTHEAFLQGTTTLEIDGQELRIDGPRNLTLRNSSGNWRIIEDDFRGQKNPEQVGPLREVLKNRFMFVVGTSGNDAEDQDNLRLARFHAEVFAYGGNGSVDVLTDREYLKLKDQARNVVLFGNLDTNAAWKHLLADSPIRVTRGSVFVGDREMKGNDLCALAVRPMKGESRALVGFLASTGPAGQRTLERLPLFTPGAHYPDWAVFSSEYLLKGGVKDAGFFDSDWTVQSVSNPL